MQRLARSALLTLLAGVLLPGMGAAQSASQVTAQTTVTVRIPTILRLDVSTDTADGRSVQFHIDGATVTPGSLIVKVLANASWQLSVKDISGGSDGAPLLAYSLETARGWSAFETAQPGIEAIVTSGDGPTGGWRDLPMRFALADPAIAPSGSSTRTLEFTLTRP